MSSEALVPIDVTSELVISRAPDLVLAEAAKAATALKDVIEKKPKKVMFNGEQYLEFEDWQTLARFYGITAKVVETTYVQYGEAHGFEAKAVAIRADGMEISAAEAACLTDEDKWRGRPKFDYKDGMRVQVGEEPVPLFQLKSMAQTRACAKVLRNVLAWVAVMAGYRPTPAEELETHANAPSGTQAQTTQPTTRTGESIPNDGLLRVVPPVDKKDGVGKNGKPYTRYMVTFSDGRKASTFDAEIGALAATFARDGMVVEADIEQAGKFSNLNGLRAADQPRTESAHAGGGQPEPGGKHKQILSVAKVVELGERAGVKTYGIITKELGDGAVLQTTNKEHARAALSARKQEQKIEAVWDERTERKGDAETVARYLTDVSLQLAAAEETEPDGEVRELAGDEIPWGSR